MDKKDFLEKSPEEREFLIYEMAKKANENAEKARSNSAMSGGYTILFGAVILTMGICNNQKTKKQIKELKESKEITVPAPKAADAGTFRGDAGEVVSTTFKARAFTPFLNLMPNDSAK